MCTVYSCFLTKFLDKISNKISGKNYDKVLINFLINLKKKKKKNSKFTNYITAGKCHRPRTEHPALSHENNLCKLAYIKVEYIKVHFSGPTRRVLKFFLGHSAGGIVRGKGKKTFIAEEPSNPSSPGILRVHGVAYIKLL